MLYAYSIYAYSIYAYSIYYILYAYSIYYILYAYSIYYILTALYGVIIVQFDYALIYKYSMCKCYQSTAAIVTYIY